MCEWLLPVVRWLASGLGPLSVGESETVRVSRSGVGAQPRRNPVGRHCPRKKRKSTAKDDLPRGEKEKTNKKIKIKNLPQHERPNLVTSPFAEPCMSCRQVRQHLQKSVCNMPFEARRSRSISSPQGLRRSFAWVCVQCASMALFQGNRGWPYPVGGLVAESRSVGNVMAYVFLLVWGELLVWRERDVGGDSTPSAKTGDSASIHRGARMDVSMPPVGR